MTHIAYQIADELKASIEPGCTRVEIAGSLRRKKEEPKDIEIVCQPSIGVYEMKDMFDEVYERREVNWLDVELGKLYDSGALELDPVTKRNGKNYKRLRHTPSGLACDLFIVTDPRKWGLIYTIRTGSWRFSKDLVSEALRKGWFVQHGLLHQHTPERDDLGDVKECQNGETCSYIFPTLEEEDVFNVLGIPWIEPKDRTTLSEALAVVEQNAEKIG